MSNEASGEHTCPRCGTPFTCGLRAKQDHCWCFDFPHVISLENASREGCLCRDCLSKLIESIQQQQQEQHSHQA